MPCRCHMGPVCLPGEKAPICTHLNQAGGWPRRGFPEAGAESSGSQRIRRAEGRALSLSFEAGGTNRQPWSWGRAPDTTQPQGGTPGPRGDGTTAHSDGAALQGSGPGGAPATGRGGGGRGTAHLCPGPLSSALGRRPRTFPGPAGACGGHQAFGTRRTPWASARSPRGTGLAAPGFRPARLCSQDPLRPTWSAPDSEAARTKGASFGSVAPTPLQAPRRHRPAPWRSVPARPLPVPAGTRTDATHPTTRGSPERPAALGAPTWGRPPAAWRPRSGCVPGGCHGLSSSRVPAQTPSAPVSCIFLCLRPEAPLYLFQNHRSVVKTFL